MDEEDGDVESVKTGKNRKSSKDRKTGGFAEKRQQLFLVEFLIDCVTIDSCAVDEEILEGQTCLSVSFLNFPPMDICEKDFDQNKEPGVDKVKFNCGKSLMFAFNEKQCDHPPPLSVELTVSKKLGEDKNPFKVDIGTIKICISELFRQIVDIAKFKPDKLPASKSIKDCFMLIGPGKRTMGEVSIYIRLSCLGQNIVTEFQCGSDMKANPVLFKNREGKKVFEFTGNEAQEEDYPVGGAPPKSGKVGCGCLKPAATQSRGGQGDAERTSPSSGMYTKGNKVILDVPDKSSRNQKEKRDECRNRQSYTVKRNTLRDDMTISKVNENPDQNCFILRVGDKGQIPDRGKMILEFRTPKQRMPPKILPPYHEDIGVQTDSPKKGKGKGKKK
ncbi:hypothetical protein RUM44_010000 [Polyplax serrata]|uniref:Uncharacterized protein n=1 Tax=Polyplax serrata TaxID=468196 RepID=A0ABR1AUB1_POLSC